MNERGDNNFDLRDVSEGRRIHLAGRATDGRGEARRWWCRVAGVADERVTARQARTPGRVGDWPTAHPGTSHPPFPSPPNIYLSFLLPTALRITVTLHPSSPVPAYLPFRPPSPPQLRCPAHNRTRNIFFPSPTHLLPQVSTLLPLPQPYLLPRLLTTTFATFASRSPSQ